MTATLDLAAAPAAAVPDLDRRARLVAVTQLWLANLVAGTAIATAYLAHVPADSSPRTWLFVAVALVSTVATLALVPTAAILALSWLVRSPRTAALLSGATGSAFLCLLYADTRIYSILRYHFNAAVWNSLTTRGAGDAVQLGWWLWTLGVVVFAAVALVEAWLWRRAHARARRAVRRERARRVIPRRAIVCALVLLPVVLLEKGIYAAAHREQDRLLTHTSQVFPLCAHLQVGRLLDDPEVISDRRPRVAVLPENARLAYPRATPAIAASGRAPERLPSILLVVLDSWRQDAFTPELTPRIAEWARDARVFEDHLAAGNGTRFGIFAMLYGLHGSYWFPMLAERRPPVLLDELGALGYDVRVFSSASMSFPEFRETAWAELEGRVHDDYPQRLSYQRDEAVAADVEAWLGLRADEPRPFFAFVLLDAPHQPYHSPGGPFQPSAERLDYLELAQTAEPAFVERVHNRYRNSVLHADGSAARILAALEREGLAASTLVVVTGDHGEEFQENGFWGHTSNFTAEQVAVPFLMRGPGVPPGRETRPTSHLDLAPTFLELLGADPALRGDWCLGENLLAPLAERRRVLSGFSELGVWTPHGILRVPMDPTAPLGPEVRDADWNFVRDQDAICEREAATFERLEEECSRFLAPRDLAASQ